MATIATLAVKVIGDTTSLVNSLETAGKRVDRFGGRLKAMRGQLLAVAGAAVGAGGVSVKMASDLGESVNKANEVFGDFTDGVERFAETSARSFGISRRAAFDYTGTLGTILRATGMNKEAAAGMSIELTQLAADMASFNNLSIDEALNKIRAGLVGETEPLRTVGVLLSAAAVEAKAMELGLADANGELTEAAKVQARYALILEQTAVQQGDFTRTSDSLANQTRILKASLENAAASLGMVLLPHVEKGVALLVNLVNAFNKLPGPVKVAIVAAVGVTAAIAALGLAIPFLIVGFKALVVAAVILGKGLLALTGVAFGPVGLAILALITAGVLLIKHWDDLRETARKVFTSVVDFIVSTVNRAIEVIQVVAEKLAFALPEGVSEAIRSLKQFKVDSGAVFDSAEASVKGFVESASSKVAELKDNFLGFGESAAGSVDTARQGVESLGEKVEETTVKIQGMSSALAALDSAGQSHAVSHSQASAFGPVGGPALSPSDVEKFAEAAGMTFQEAVEHLKKNLPPGVMVGFNKGGIINEPTVLSSLRTGQPFGVMAESRPEAIVPLGGRGHSGGDTNVHIHGDVYGMDDFERRIERAGINIRRRGGWSWQGA